MKGRSGLIRSQRGALATLILGLLLIATFMVCALALDIAHATHVRTELHCATDAGALAGATTLAKDPLNGALAAQAQADAEAVTSVNKADGIPVVDNQPAGAVVTPTTDISNPQQRYCTVTATRTFNNMFAKIFGVGTSQFEVSSTAVSQRGIIQMPARVPLLCPDPYIPAPSGANSGLTLSQWASGPRTSPWTLLINPQSVKNCAWISQPGNDAFTTDPLSVGQTVPLQNGSITAQLTQFHVGDTLIMPMITGGAPYNHSRVIIGFIGMKVVSTNYPHSLDVQIVDNAVGPSGSIPGQVSDMFTTQYGPWKVMLSK